MHGETILRICFIAVFCLLSAARLYFRLRSGAIRDRIFTSDEGALPVLLRWILGLPLVAATAAYCFTPGLWPWMYAPLPLGVRVAGVVLGLASVALIVVVHLTLGVCFSSALVLRPEHRLIRVGPYRYVRHPMYTAYLALFVAAFAMSANWVVGLSGAAVIATLMTLRLAKEEAMLLRRFGADYELYRRTTGMFLPRPSAVLRLARRGSATEESLPGDSRAES